MGNVDFSDLRKWVDELDGLLVSGTVKYRRMYADYNTESKVEGFDLEKYKIDGSKEWDEWADKCVSILDKLPRKHYLFHFVQPRSDGMMRTGIPVALGGRLVTFEYQLYALEDIILGLEENEGLALRKEIADKEYQADVLYKVTRIDHSRKVRINNIVLHASNYDSENDNFMAYVIANPGRPIPRTELEQACGTLTKRLDHIIRDLGFTGNLAKVFFPVKTKNEVMFVNPITKQYAFKNELPALNFIEIGRASKVE